MAEATPPLPRPRGPALDWTDADLDALSTISQADVEQAKLLWRQQAPRPLRTLLDAQLDPEEMGG